MLSNHESNASRDEVLEETPSAGGHRSEPTTLVLLIRITVTPGSKGPIVSQLSPKIQKTIPQAALRLLP